MLLPKSQGDILQPQRPSLSALYSNGGQTKKQVAPNAKLAQKRRTVGGSTMHVSIKHSSYSNHYSNHQLINLNCVVIHFALIMLGF